MIMRAWVPLIQICIASTLLPDPVLLRSLLAGYIVCLAALLMCVERRRRSIAFNPRSLKWSRCWTACEFLASAVWASLLVPVARVGTWGVATLMVCVTVLIHILVTTVGCSNAKWIRRAVVAGAYLVILPLVVFHAMDLGIYPILSFLEIGGGAFFITKMMLRQTHDVLHAQLDREKLADNLQASLKMSDYVARHDGLTGLLNRRAFEDMVQTLRDEQPAGAIAIVLIDLDHFKRINDTYGHPAGDAVLRAVGELANSSRRKGDAAAGKRIAARWGGEEFIVAVCNCPFDRALIEAEILRERLARHRDTSWPAGLAVTASMGAARWEVSDPLELAIAAADTALYQAKHAGRNRVFAAGTPHDSTVAEARPAGLAQAFTSA